MKIKLSKDALVKSLTSLTGIINVRTTLPILSNVLIETKGKDQVILTTTDMEIGISKQCNAEADEEGSITIPAKKLLDIVKELPQDSVSLEVSKNNSIQITSGKAFIKLIGLPKDDFPVFPGFDETEGIEIKREILQECLRLTSFAISTDENKYVLNGMLFKLKNNLLEMVATDGRRLAFMKKKIEFDKKVEMEFIIPVKTIHEVLRIQGETDENVRIITLKNQVVFQFKDGFIISRLIEGHFPDYDKVIPKSSKLSSGVNRNGLLSVLRRAYLLTSKEAQGIKMDFLNNKILISVKSPNLGELKEEIEVEQKTDGVTIGFNPQFLIDVLKNLDEDEILFEINEADKPGLIRRKDGDYLCVIMPMQIN